jgi:hypothetical protein
MKHLKESFPARLFNILPKGNIFNIIQQLSTNEQIKDNLYIRGKYIKYLQPDEAEPGLISLIPHMRVEEEKPKLEDIYIYYERLEEKKQKIK